MQLIFFIKLPEEHSIETNALQALLRFFSYKSNGNSMCIATAKLYVSLLQVRKEYGEKCREQKGQLPLELTKQCVDLS